MLLLTGVAALAVSRQPRTLARAAPNGAESSATSADRAGADRDATLWMEMRNVDLHINPRSVMHVQSLRGQVLTKPGVIAWLDQPASFKVRATSGVVTLNGDAISALLNDVAFNYPGAPIRNLRVTIENGSLVQRGTLLKGVPIPFQMWSVPVLQPDGRLKLHPDRLKILGVNGSALMHALGLHLDKMMNLSKARGASVTGDDIYLDPLQIIPRPMVEGKVTSVRIEGTLLVQEFARTADDTIFGTFVKPDSGSRNFVYFRGGILRFGKLTMTDTDLLIHDDDEGDPFDLYFAEYNRQLVAGHTNNLPNLGLRTWMVDYAKLGVAAREKSVARR
ncbi:MAG: hypothetical protein ACJ79A_20420 [Gemmatimonadaceae bacterium]